MTKIATILFVCLALISGCGGGAEEEVTTTDETATTSTGSEVEEDRAEEIEESTEVDPLEEPDAHETMPP
jgi:hypothetical protein